MVLQDNMQIMQFPKQKNLKKTYLPTTEKKATQI